MESALKITYCRYIRAHTVLAVTVWYIHMSHMCTIYFGSDIQLYLVSTISDRSLLCKIKPSHVCTTMSSTHVQVHVHYGLNFGATIDSDVPTPSPPPTPPPPPHVPNYLSTLTALGVHHAGKMVTKCRNGIILSV